jgi:hypothetical protein
MPPEFKLEQAAMTRNMTMVLKGLRFVRIARGYTKLRETVMLYRLFPRPTGVAKARN